MRTSSSAPAVASQLYFCAELRLAERCADDEVASPTVVTEIVDRKGEAVDVDAIESVHSGERHLIIGCGEVEVGREAACISRSEFS